MPCQCCAVTSIKETRRAALKNGSNDRGNPRRCIFLESPRVTVVFTGLTIS